MTPDDAARLAIGATFSKHHVFNPDQVRAFATAAGDTNPLHHDEDAARASRYGRLIVSGTQTTALMLGLAAEHFSARFSVVGVKFAVEFLRPVFADARVTLEWEIVDVTGDAARMVQLRGGVVDGQGVMCVAATGTVRVQAAAPL